MHHLFNRTYENRNVLITGHTGFKGSWLAQWLVKMGANVTGVALEPYTTPNHFSALNLGAKHYVVDIRDAERLKEVILTAQPEIIFHLAAQPLVRYSYQHPKLTFETNVIGTVNLYEACRVTDSLSSIVTITSDKVYANRELSEGYSESDQLGGFDPYSNSKACVELLTSCYRNSFFTSHGELNKRIATVRAGNVIGGGDWATDRIVPDVVRAAASGLPSLIRNPNSIRPWQHVLDPLSGYLLVGEKLLSGDDTVASEWNFGPSQESTVPVKQLVEAIADHWNAVSVEYSPDNHAPKETKMLTLKSDKARKELKWLPVWDFHETIKKVADWYKEYYQNKNLLSDKQIESYVTDAINQGTVWVS